MWFHSSSLWRPRHRARRCGSARRAQWCCSTQRQGGAHATTSRGTLASLDFSQLASRSSPMRRAWCAAPTRLRLPKYVPVADHGGAAAAATLSPLDDLRYGSTFGTYFRHRRRTLYHSTIPSRDPTSVFVVSVFGCSRTATEVRWGFRYLADTPGAAEAGSAPVSEAGLPAPLDQGTFSVISQERLGLVKDESCNAARPLPALHTDAAALASPVPLCSTPGEIQRIPIDC